MAALDYSASPYLDPAGRAKVWGDLRAFHECESLTAAIGGIQQCSGRHPGAVREYGGAQGQRGDALDVRVGHPIGRSGEEFPVHPGLDAYLAQRALENLGAFEGIRPGQGHNLIEPSPQRGVQQSLVVRGRDEDGLPSEGVEHLQERIDHPLQLSVLEIVAAVLANSVELIKEHNHRPSRDEVEDAPKVGRRLS
jgi:hypothetical protein